MIKAFQPALKPRRLVRIICSPRFYSGDYATRHLGADVILAALERVPTVRDAKFESPVTREAVNGRLELDRFAIVARLEERP